MDRKKNLNHSTFQYILCNLFYPLGGSCLGFDSPGNVCKATRYEYWMASDYEKCPQENYESSGI